MLKLGILGINFKQANVKKRDALAKACHKLFGLGSNELFEAPFILLSTCNRTEIYFSSHNLADAHSQLLSLIRQEVREEFEQKLYSFFGNECFEHLCRVTAGLDSAELFETEIQGQVKSAYLRALDHQPLNSDLHFLFQKALKVGKSIRAGYPVPKGIPSLEQIIYHVGKQSFGLLDPRILFVGASTINKKVIPHVQKRGYQNITICNRTDSKAEQIAERFGTRVLPWEGLHKWKTFDWIIFGTSAPQPIFSQRHLLTEPFTKKLIMDLSVPRNVDSHVGRHSNITLFDIDQLQLLLGEQRNLFTGYQSEIEAIVKRLVGRQLCTFRQTQTFHLQEIIG